jgi:hypothetical protein
MHQVYTTYVAETSAQGQEVIQPSAQDMLRYWQAYQMTDHTYYSAPITRELTTSMQVVQVRLWVLITTLTTFVLALAAAAAAHFTEPRDEHGDHLSVPNTQLDWIVEAARQQHVEDDHKSHVDYAKERRDLFFAVSTARTGLSRSRITSNRDKSITQPFLGYTDPYDTLAGGDSAISEGRPILQPLQFESGFNPYFPYDSSTVPVPSTPGSGGNPSAQPFLGDFDPHSLYESSVRESWTTARSYGWNGK